jgi:hypothetical protein
MGRFNMGFIDIGVARLTSFGSYHICSVWTGRIGLLREEKITAYDGCQDESHHQQLLIL